MGCSWQTPAGAGPRIGRSPGPVHPWAIAALTAVLTAWSAPRAAAAPARAPASATAPQTVRIVRIEIAGREQVSLREIQLALEREGVVAGIELPAPDADPRVQRARDRLRATGYFRRVTPRLQVVPGTRDEAVLVFDLEERTSVSILDLYLGSSRMTPFRGGLSLVERNFLGRSVHLGGAFVWGTLPRIDKSRRQQAYKIFVDTPRIGRAPLGIVARAYLLSAAEPYRVAGAEDDPNPDLFRTFDYSRLGGVLGLTFPLGPRLSIGGDYRLERVDAQVPDDPAWVRPDGEVRPVELDVRGGKHRLAAAHFGLTWDGRGDAFLAGQGGRFALDLQLSSPAIASNYEYIKLVAGGLYSFRLPWRHWLVPSLQGGQIAGNAPRFEQFYSGDLSAWTPGREQGLRYSTRNPIDVFGMGMDTRSFGHLFGRVDLEYVIPIFRRTRTRRVYGGDLFISSGIYTLAGDRDDRAQRRADDQRVAPLGFNANIGLRLDTELGTFNVSVGSVLRRTPL